MPLIEWASSDFGEDGSPHPTAHLAKLEISQQVFNCLTTSSCFDCPCYGIYITSNVLQQLKAIPAHPHLLTLFQRSRTLGKAFFLFSVSSKLVKSRASGISWVFLAGNGLRSLIAGCDEGRKEEGMSKQNLPKFWALPLYLEFCGCLALASSTLACCSSYLEAQTSWPYDSLPFLLSLYPENTIPKTWSCWGPGYQCISCAVANILNSALQKV